jgi:hypothetical protein
MSTVSTKKPKEIQPEFVCEFCDYSTCNKKDYTKHLTTDKHKNNEKSPKIPDLQQEIPKNPKTIVCVCGKIYKERSGLWRHKLKCSGQEVVFHDLETVIQEKERENELMLTILKENSELKTMILEVCKTMASTSNSTNNSINNNSINNNSINDSNNKTFNIQVYLNEECKNALNLSDFVSSIQLQLHDLEETGRLGYVDGVSQIINTKLHDLDATMRPIQCSDVKRETLYIKEENKWFKEDDKKEKIKNAIKQITRKNIHQIPGWVKANPGCTDSQSKDNDAYLQIVFNAMSGDSTEEQSNNVNKIVTKVSKGAAIEK